MPQLTVSFLTLLGITIAQLVVPSIIRDVIDVGLKQGEAKYMLRSGLIILALGIARALLSALQKYLSESVSMKFAYDTRNRLFQHIQKLSFSYHDHAQTGQLMSRCTEDIRSIQAFIGTGLIEITQVILLLVGAMVLMLNQSVSLTLIAISPLIPLILLTADFGSRVSKLFYAVDRSLGELSAKLQENVTGAQVVRAFTREPHEIKRFDESNRTLFDARIHVLNEWSKIMPTTMMLVSLTTILLLWFGGKMVLAGTITIGQVVEFNSLMLLIELPARQLTWHVNSAGEAAAGIQRIFEILNEEPKIKSKSDPVIVKPIKGKVEFKDVTFTYRGENKPSLQNISFSVQPNQVIGLIGPTGSGKSTLVNLLPRFYDVTQGQILVDDIDVRDHDLENLRSQIGYVLQSTLLFSSSIADNIAFGNPDATQDQVIAAAKSAQAHDFISGFPEGYNTVIGERGITLSGGQRQRVAIARALLINPSILIMDDSTSSVDTETEHLIQQAFSAIMHNRTTFIITQRISSIRNADKILVLDQGKIIERGTHQELIGKDGLYNQIYTSQLSISESA